MRPFNNRFEKRFRVTLTNDESLETFFKSRPGQKETKEPHFFTFRVGPLRTRLYQLDKLLEGLENSVDLDKSEFLFTSLKNGFIAFATGEEMKKVLQHPERGPDLIDFLNKGEADSPEVIQEIFPTRAIARRSIAQRAQFIDMLPDPEAKPPKPGDERVVVLNERRAPLGVLTRDALARQILTPETTFPRQRPGAKHHA